MSQIVFALLVAYNPETGFDANLRVVEGQVDRLFLVDNSTDVEAIGLVDRLVAASSKIELVRPGGNIGLAKAQNIGLTAALQKSPDWVLLVDDDSLISPNLVTDLLAGLKPVPKPASVGILAPRVLDHNTEVEGRIIVSNGPWHIWRKLSTLKDTCLDNALTVISSGSLIRAAVFKKIGMFKEQYFIDSLDIEFCLRVRSKYWKIVVVHGAVMEHALGNKSQHKAACASFLTTNHATWRRYTMYRNRADVWKNYIGRFPAYVAYDMLVSCYELYKITAFEDAKVDKLKAAMHGLVDGMRGYFDNENLFRKP